MSKSNRPHPRVKSLRPAEHYLQQEALLSEVNRTLKACRAWARNYGQETEFDRDVAGGAWCLKQLRDSLQNELGEEVQRTGPVAALNRLRIALAYVAGQRPEV